ncbi:MAG: hypothetical protein WD069_11795 [Planctomycetales bacterium]
MTEPRLDTRFHSRLRRRGFTIFAVLVVPLLGFIYLADVERLWFLCVWVAGVVAALASYWWTLARYRCPKCGRTIGDLRTGRFGHEMPIVFRCTACDIEWDTGVRTPPEDSGGGGGDMAAGCD